MFEVPCIPFSFIVGSLNRGYLGYCFPFPFPFFCCVRRILVELRAKRNVRRARFFVDVMGAW